MQQIIGKVNPELYAENGKELLKKYKTADKIPAEEVKPKSDNTHKILYDSGSESLEPLYFFVLDLMKDFGLDPIKYVDNFVSTSGSGYFSELRGRATAMQQQADNMLKTIYTIIRSVTQIIYDLKEFQIRLSSYDNFHSKDGAVKDAATMSLKQIWMDKVDMQKGNSSIKGMAMGQAGFQTLIDAFLAAKDIKSLQKLDLNERVRRILIPRVQEFNAWVGASEMELRKRYELQRNYLKSQVANLKLYSRWVKPYLKAAQDLEMGEAGRKPDLVKTFSTIVLELTLLGKNEIKVKDYVADGKLPVDFTKMDKKKKFKRKYYACTLVDFRFRGLPQRVMQRGDYSFGGRTEMTFTAYALNEEELKKIDEVMDSSDLANAFQLIETSTSESLNELEKEVNMFLDDKESEKKQKAKSRGENPFLALIGHYDRPDKKDKE